ncbi:MAG TPA: MarR family transcriptional regulator [Solirubrobacterales bacterium]|nr:MarR family transcriptional regulator [Solirubrobacterales bacterium]
MVTTSGTSQDERIADAASRLRFAIVRTARRMRQQAGGELSPTLIAALASIDRLGPLTPSELADVERVKRPTATRVAAALERDGLIVRAADPADGRACLLSTSPKGRALMKRVRSRKNAYLSRRIRKLDESDVETLERAAEVLEQMLEDPS